MEYWNVGIMGEKKSNQNPIISLFQSSLSDLPMPITSIMKLEPNQPLFVKKFLKNLKKMN